MVRTVIKLVNYEHGLNNSEALKTAISYSVMILF